jgi:nitroimidazol reductase NimA-like FMN-containing flavoprotein (pyridoxamine 5'-phosphate oxidase superfamily)
MTTNDSSFDEWSPQGPVTELSDDRSWALLDGASFGHLGVSIADQPEIFPVNYHSDGSTVLFRTAEGTKLHELIANSSVVFEVDSQSSDGAWSVTVKGRARVIELLAEVAQADLAPFPDWVPTVPYVYVEIAPRDIHGRQFHRHLMTERS